MPLNPTLQLAQKHGMSFKYVSREDYRNKNQESFIDNLEKEFGDFYHVPEGGSNALAVKGCTENILLFVAALIAIGTGFAHFSCIFLGPNCYAVQMAPSILFVQNPGLLRIEQP